MVGEIDLNNACFRSGVIDPVSGYAYYGGCNRTITKVALGDGYRLPRVVATVQLESGEDEIISGLIDPAGGYSYFGTRRYPGVSGSGSIVKVELGEGDAPPVRIGALAMNPGDNAVEPGIIDPDAGFAIFGINRSGAEKLVKISTPRDHSLPVILAELQLDDSLSILTCSAFDVNRRRAYFGTLRGPGNNSPSAIIQIDTGVGDTSPVVLQTLSLAQTSEWSNIYNLLSMEIDADGDYLYACSMHGDVVKIATGLHDVEMLAVSSLRFAGPVMSVTLDPIRGRLYAARRSNSQITQIDVVVGDAPIGIIG